MGQSRARKPAATARGPEASLTLRAYVERGCRSCAHALELVERIDREYPEVSIQVVDVGVSSEQLPDGVFAVPTLVLDGDPIALGTPSWDRIADELDARLAAP